MAKVYDAIKPALSDWLQEQKIFFVATAPLAADGFVNCSPKGMDTFRILGPNTVAYLDLTGSGIETVAHLQENGRAVIMFTAFSGPPKIVRLHGTGDVVTREDPSFADLIGKFPAYPGARAIVRLQVSRVSDSCGFSVPLYEYAGERDTLVKWAEKKGADGVERYQRENNATSLDGLPGLKVRG